MNDFFDLPLKLSCEQDLAEEYSFIESMTGELFIVGKGAVEDLQTYDVFERKDIIPSLIEIYEKVKSTPEEKKEKVFAQLALDWVSKHGYLTTRICHINTEETVNCQSLNDFQKELEDIVVIWEAFKDITNSNQEYPADIEYIALQIEEKINIPATLSPMSSFFLLFRDKRVTKNRYKKTLDFKPEIQFNNLISALYIQLLIYMKTDNIKVCPGCNTPFEATRVDRKYCSDPCKSLINMRNLRKRKQ